MAARGTDDLEDAFIGYIADADRRRPEPKSEQTAADAASQAAATPPPSAAPARAPGAGSPASSLGRLLAYSRRETLRRSSATRCGSLFAFLGSALMMLAFGFGITTDVENIRFAVPGPRPVARRAAPTSPRSRARATSSATPPAQTPEELQQRLESHEIEVALEVPPNFGRNFGKATRAEITAWSTAPTHTAPRAITPVRRRRASTTSCTSRRGAAPAPLPGQRRGRDRRPASLYNPSVRERLRHRAQRARHPADPDPGDPHGGEHRPREGTRLDHQLLRDADPAARVPAGQAAPLHRRSA